MCMSLTGSQTFHAQCSSIYQSGQCEMFSCSDRFNISVWILCIDAGADPDRGESGLSHGQIFST